MSTSTTSSAPAATSTSNGGGSGGGSGGPTSSPLLFFVALGFGVVFTNLWIIVGVKYCFRYNQRNRQLRNEENGEGMDMATMPRAHRRRREKKLMTMDEVNERFPLVKYKAWRASRAAEGLPTAGGVAATTSRPASMKAPSIKDEATKEEAENIRESQDGGPVIKSVTAETDLQSTSVETREKTAQTAEPETTTAARPSTAQSKAPAENRISKVDTTEHDLDEDDEQIQTALPAEMLGDPGDSCAICIDNIDDDDDVRGLTCGHAFHAHCVDPWLTSRRACCPLCKADYYIPKPRPEGADANAEVDRQGRRVRGGVNMPQSPPYALMGGSHRRPRMILPGRFMTIVYSPNDRYGFPQVQREPRPSSGRQSSRGPTSEAAPTSPNNDGNLNITGSNSGLGSRIRNIRLPRLNPPTLPTVSNPFRRSSPNRPNTQVGTSEPSPSQLEAGQTARS